MKGHFWDRDTNAVFKAYSLFYVCKGKLLVLRYNTVFINFYPIYNTMSYQVRENVDNVQTMIQNR